MVKSSILIDLDDPRTAKIADVISNKTTKKILALLTESEQTKTQLAKSLSLPLNTIEYNINNLEETGLIEKSKIFLWSVKGKRIHKYRLSNKKIIISPKSMINNIIPTLFIISILAVMIKFLITPTQTSTINDAMQKISQEAGQMPTAISPSKTTEIAPQIYSSIASNSWLWFLLGALCALLIFIILNSKKK